MRLLFSVAIAVLLFPTIAPAQTWKLVSPGGGSGGGSTPGVGQGVSCMPPWGGDDGFIPHGEGVIAYSTATTGSCESRSQMRWCVNGTLSGSATHTQKICSGSCSLGGVTKAAGESHIFYSETYHVNCASVSQSRTCTNGVFSGDAPFNKTTCGWGCEHGPIGTACADGAIYIGTTNGNRIYAAPSDETFAYQWGGRGESATGATAADGLSNTNWLAGFGTKHPAAKACHDKTGGNWYLPSSYELASIFPNSTSPFANPGGPLNLEAMGFSTSSATYYWASNQNTTDHAYAARFSNQSGSGTNFYLDKNSSGPVRCVRR